MYDSGHLRRHFRRLRPHVALLPHGQAEEEQVQAEPENDSDTKITKSPIKESESIPNEKTEISQDDILSDNVLADIDQPEVLVKENAVDETAELLALEKEIQELEQKEQIQEKQKKQKEDILDFSSEDIWDLGGSNAKENANGTIRFAEDIESLNTFKSDGKKPKKSVKRKKNKR